MNAKGNQNADSKTLSSLWSDPTTTTYNPFNNISPEGGERAPEIGLLHELKHAYDVDHEGMERDAVEPTTDVHGNPARIKTMEVRAVNTENILRDAVYGEGENRRTTYTDVYNRRLVVPLNIKQK